MNTSVYCKVNMKPGFTYFARESKYSCLHEPSKNRIQFLCNCSLPLSHGAMGWSAVCDCGISWPHSLFEKFHVRYLLADYSSDVSVAALHVISYSQGSQRNLETKLHDFSMIFHDQQYNFHDYLMYGFQPPLLAASSPH